MRLENGQEIEVIQNSGVEDTIPNKTTVRLLVQPAKINVFTEDGNTPLIVRGTADEYCQKFNLWMGIALLILCFFIIFVVYPLILILYKSVIDPESSKLTLDYFTKFLHGNITGVH